MLNNPHRCVIDAVGNYITFVLLTEQADGALPYGYTVQAGESLIAVSPPSNMIAPRWIGSAWEETGTRVITPEDLEQLRTSKLQMVNSAAQQAIYSGTVVHTSEGDKQFSLTEVDQINITALFSQLQAAVRGEESSINPAKGVPYHADGELCKYWSVEDFAAIAQTATAYVFYHQTYCNHLRQHIKEITDYDELDAVQYGMPLPPTLAASMAELIGAPS